MATHRRKRKTTTKKRKRNPTVKKRNSTRHLTEIELKAIAFLSTLSLAAIAIIQHINDPVVWAFLGTALGIIAGQAGGGKKV